MTQTRPCRIRSARVARSESGKPMTPPDTAARRFLRVMVPIACLLSTGIGVCIGHGLWGPGGVLR